MKVTTTIDAHPKCPAQLLADGNEKTLYQRGAAAAAGIVALSEFTEL